MARIELKTVTKSFQAVEVIHGVSLDIEDGAFTVFVGPSGCGKSTLLRMMAGLEEVTSGEIAIDGSRCDHLMPAARGMAMVFQSYALYPHMSVEQNLRFGLENLRTPKTEIEARVARAAEILQISHLLKRRPNQLSGGQRQRVAIGRAIVKEPKAFLFDEPLSNLDAELRVKMRGELVALHQRLKSTMVYVTHDQVEAMTMADRIVVMRDGRIEQVGTPTEIYENPADVFTARFIGSPAMNLLPARSADNAITVTGATNSLAAKAPPASTALIVSVRSHDLIVGAAPSPGGLTLSGSISAVEPLGAETLVHVALGDAEITATAPGKIIPEVGSTVTASAAPGSLYLFDAQSEKSLGRA